MTTSLCPSCGAEYEPGVATCSECGVALDEGADEEPVLVYEMEGWEPEERSALDRLLDAEGVPHRWEGDELVVPEGSEAQVDDLMDEIEYPDALEPAEQDDDDEAVYSVISDLFVAADRVSAEQFVDVDLAGDLAMASAAASSTPAPFGIEAAAWAQVQQMSEAIVAEIEAGADDEVIVRDAATLRDVLRRFV